MSYVPERFTTTDWKVSNGKPTLRFDEASPGATTFDQLDKVLTRVKRSVEESRDDSEGVRAALDDLFFSLHDLKFAASDSVWRRLIQKCREHPLRHMVHEDPFTYRAFVKPRGYSGDAVTLDYVYGREEFWPPPAASPLGRRIFDYTTLAPASQGVRARRGFIADLLDGIADSARTSRAHVLSIGCGHLREAELSSAIKRRRLGRLLALDADEASLEQVDRCYRRFGVECLQARIRELLSGKVECGEFDLIYSTGLFDYLSEAAGRRLVGRLFTKLRRNGRLLVANFLPGIRDVGYMEAFMDWELVYRTRQDMINLTMDIAQEELHDIEIFAEENQNIIFLLMTRN